MLRAVLLTSALAFSSAGLAGPCAAPSGVDPVLPESLCFKELVPTNPSGISIRQYNAPNNATFASGGGAGAYPNGLQAAIATVLNYFSGANDEQRSILTARTTPFIILPPSRGPYWASFLEVSPTQFPDNFLIPRPLQGVSLSPVNNNLGNTLIASFQFNTTGFPYLENIQEACGVIQNSTLPKGYAINTTHPFSPSYAFYNGMSSTDFTSECWMVVYAL
jgi:hypothetical protein